MNSDEPDNAMAFGDPRSVEISFHEVDPEILRLLVGTALDGRPTPMSEVELIVPIKRTFWQWLLRKPKEYRAYYFPQVEVREGG